MGEQRILLDADWNQICREREQERKLPPACCCQNGGAPFLLDSVWVTSRNAGCQVHAPASRLYAPIGMRRRASRMR